MDAKTYSTALENGEERLFFTIYLFVKRIAAAMRRGSRVVWNGLADSSGGVGRRNWRVRFDAAVEARFLS